MIHNQHRTAPRGEIRPNPLQEDAHAQTRLRQEPQVNRGPHKPSHKARYVYRTALEDSEALANNRHAALVKIAKWARRRSAE